jgi:excisionase family DNA binding protein
MVGQVRLHDAVRIDQFVVERENDVASVGDLNAVGEAAARLGVGEHRLRLLIRRGAIRTSQLTPTGILAISTAALEDARPLLGDADLQSSTCLSLGEAAQRAGVTRSELRSAADRGLVECDRTAGNHRRFTIDAVDAFKASLKPGDTDATLLAIGDAARLAGVSVAVLRAAVATGRISCVRSSRDHRRFSFDDVMSYAARCGSSLHQ